MKWTVTDINEDTHEYMKKLLEAKKSRQNDIKHENENCDDIKCENSKHENDENKVNVNLAKDDSKNTVSLWYYFFLGLLNSLLFYLVFMRYHNMDDVMKDLNVAQKIIADTKQTMIQYYRICEDYTWKAYDMIKKN